MRKEYWVSIADGCWKEILATPAILKAAMLMDAGMASEPAYATRNVMNFKDYPSLNGWVRQMENESLRVYYIHDSLLMEASEPT